MCKNNLIKIFLFSLLIFLLFLNCQNNYLSSSATKYPEAVSQNFNIIQLTHAIDKLSQIPGIKSIVVGRKGVIAVEEYYNDGGADIIHDVRSVTKSVMGLLIGIAIEKGYIQNVNQTVGEYFIGTLLDTLEPAKAQITIENLLTMSCGLEWHELDGGNDYMNWYWSTDHVRWVLDQPFIHIPGDGFNYNTGSTHLLSVILSLATGKSALEFAQTNLFEPMGITESDWTIVPTNGIYNNGGAGLKISPHTMFAIGNLMLNNGKWNQKQLVQENWVTECKSAKNTTNDVHPYGTEYGYLWWVGQAHGRNHFFAMGWGGQFIVCVPEHDLVVVASCEWKNVPENQANQNWNDIYLIIIEEILSSISI